MTSYRQEKMNSLLSYEFGQLLLTEEEFETGVFVTVITTEISPNLKQARIFLSIFPEEKSQNIFNRLNKRVTYFQKILEKKINASSCLKIELALAPKTDLYL